MTDESTIQTFDLTLARRCPKHGLHFSATSGGNADMMHQAHCLLHAQGVVTPMPTCWLRTTSFTGLERAGSSSLATLYSGSICSSAQHCRNCLKCALSRPLQQHVVSVAQPFQVSSRSHGIAWSASKKQW